MLIFGSWPAAVDATARVGRPRAKSAGASERDALSVRGRSQRRQCGEHGASAVVAADAIRDRGMRHMRNNLNTENAMQSDNYELCVFTAYNFTPND